MQDKIRVASYRDKHNPDFRRLLFSGDKLIAETSGLEANAQEWADYIVKCVNSHQALVEALKAVDELWEGDEGFAKEKEACKGLEWDSPVYIVWKKIRAALASVEGV